MHCFAYAIGSYDFGFLYFPQIICWGGSQFFQVLLIKKGMLPNGNIEDFWNNAIE